MPSLFKKTNRKKTIEYYEPNERIDPISGEVCLDIIEDDRFTFWLYAYFDEKFYFQGLHSYCK